MFFNKRTIYKGNSKKSYDEIINILTLNNIKYDFKIENKCSIKGPIMDTIMIGSLSQKEEFSFEYTIFVTKKDYEKAKYFMKL